MRSVLASATSAIEKYAEEIESGSCVADFGARCDAIYTEALESFSSKAAGGDAAIFDSKVRQGVRWVWFVRGRKRGEARRTLDICWRPRSRRGTLTTSHRSRRHEYFPSTAHTIARLPQVEALEKSIDSPIRVLYMKQLLLLRDKVRPNHSTTPIGAPPAHTSTSPFRHT